MCYLVPAFTARIEVQESRLEFQEVCSGCVWVVGKELRNCIEYL